MSEAEPTEPSPAEPSPAERVSVEPARADDAGPLLVVQRSAYLSEAQAYGELFIPPLVETLEQVRAAIAEGGVLVARVGPRVVGSVRWRMHDGVCHVGKLSVAGDLQGRGIGSRLLEAVEQHSAQEHGAVSAYTLFTGADSPYNIRLYRRHGYRETHTEPLNERVTFVHMTKPVATPAR
jgi:ribosomal protein S18 acetylase RimI-like enzyme